MRLTTAYITTAALAVTLAILAPPAAKAAVISIEISATVEFVDDPGNILAGTVASGDTITGIYTYNSNTPDSNSLETVGDYQHTSAPYGFTLTVSGLTFRTDPGNVDFLVEITNDHGGSDNYLLRSYNNLFDVATAADANNHISWQLDDPTTTALSATTLPATPPVLSDWQSFFGLDISSRSSGGPEFLILAHVTSAALVPEPASFGLLAFGGMALLARRRREGANA